MVLWKAGSFNTLPLEQPLRFCFLVDFYGFWKHIIDLLRKQQVGETVRDLGLEGQKEKQGTLQWVGLIILASILIPTLLFAKLDNIYIIFNACVHCSTKFIGFLDDYIKVFKKIKKA